MVTMVGVNALVQSSGKGIRRVRQVLRALADDRDPRVLRLGASSRAAWMFSEKHCAEIAAEMRRAKVGRPKKLV
jgi:hypothetical protein